MSERVFLDTSVLLRYLGNDDPSRTWAAAELIDSDRVLVISGVVVTEAVHVLRVQRTATDSAIFAWLIAFLAKENVEVIDADKAHVAAALQHVMHVSARRVPDALIASAADQAGCDWIATFDEGFMSMQVPSRLL